MREKPPSDDAENKAKSGQPKKPIPTIMMGAGLELAGVIIVFSLGGWWLDSKFGTSPWLLITCLLIALVGGMYKLWRLGKQFFN